MRHLSYLILSYLINVLGYSNVQPGTSIRGLGYFTATP